MKTKDELAKVFNQVLIDIKNGYYNFFDKETDKYRIVNFKTNKLMSKSQMFDKVEKLSNTPVFKSTKIYVQNIDSFDKAKEFSGKCAVLNMASRRNPGGGVINGSRSQEEELCRRSNLIQSLYQFTQEGRDFLGIGSKKLISNYPINTFGGIYSPEVTVYKKSGNYSNLEIPFICNVISVSGVIKPELNESGMMLKKYAVITKEKIRTIFRIAIMNKNSKLVLGAFGCGAYGCPAKHIALLFKEVLNEPEFIHSFEEICFAILEDNNSVRKNNTEGNLKPFIEVFGENCYK